MRDNIALTRAQYEEIMKEIWTYHRFGGLSRKAWDDESRSDRCKYIKYVRPNWDMRDGMCFSIKFDGLGCPKDGMEFGSGYGITEPMYDRIMKWLNTPLSELKEADSA